MSIEIFKETCWIIMSKDRKLIAKGNPRDRHLIPVDSNDQKRILTYSSEGRAKAALSGANGFYGENLIEGYKSQWDWSDEEQDWSLSHWLEAVKVEISITEI